MKGKQTRNGHLIQQLKKSDGSIIFLLLLETKNNEKEKEKKRREDVTTRKTAKVETFILSVFSFQSFFFHERAVVKWKVA